MKLTPTDDRLRAKSGGNRARTEKRRTERLQPLEFHSIDGEGVTDEQGNHYYVLIGIGQEQISNPSGLELDEILEFLWKHYQSGRHAYTGYYLGYDFTEMLAKLPENRAWYLFTPAGKALRSRKTRSRFGETHFPVGWGRWEFDMLGNKRFKFRPKEYTGDYMYVCDGGPFFQASFLATINPEKWEDPICTPEEYERVKIGKEARSSAKLDDEMRFYNRLENEIAERLMGRLQEGLLSIGIQLKPSQWFGPGQVAQAWLDQQKNVPGIKKLIECVPDWFLDAARKTYYGGWFELFAHGHIPGESHEYDINSAYPYIIAALPCMLHGTYSHGYGKPKRSMDRNTLCIVQATAISNTDNTALPGNKAIGAMLHRTRKGDILRPTVTKGFFWLHELEAAQRAGCVEAVEYEHWYAYEPCSCPPPLATVAELYELRKSVGKNTALGKGIRLLINSIYGKFAQSIGTPKYGNAVYASLITAGCRTMILDAIATHPGGMNAVIMVATDGIYFVSPHNSLPLSGNLGDWEHNVHNNLCLFKPGMYWSDKDRIRIKEGKSAAFKARGINAADFSAQIEAVDALFSKWPRRVPGELTSRESFHWPEVSFTGRFALTSCVQALARGKWDQAGTVKQDVELKQSSDAHKKRSGLWYDTEAKIYRSKPWEPGIWFPVESTPYEKRFGNEDPWSIESLEEYGITPEGTITEVFTEIMMRHDD